MCGGYSHHDMLRRDVASSALLGHNGAGKSTLLTCVLGLLDYGGNIVIRGSKVGFDNDKIRQDIKIGGVVQSRRRIYMCIEL